MVTIYIKNSINPLIEPIHSIELIKVDALDPSHYLAGAVFDLFRYDEEQAGFVLFQEGLFTDENGRLLVIGLAPGRYQFVEMQAPQGYRLNRSREIPFEIAVDSEGLRIGVETLTVTNLHESVPDLPEGYEDLHEYFDAVYACRRQCCCYCYCCCPCQCRCCRSGCCYPYCCYPQWQCRQWCWSHSGQSCRYRPYWEYGHYSADPFHSCGYGYGCQGYYFNR